MRKVIFILLSLCVILVPLAAQTARLKMATTTSTMDRGLLLVLIPPLERLTGSRWMPLRWGWQGHDGLGPPLQGSLPPLPHRSLQWKPDVNIW